MSEKTYILEWRGSKRGPCSHADIEAGLAAGELHSLYKINVDGKWLVLRDFLEQHRATTKQQSSRAVVLPPPPEPSPIPLQRSATVLPPPLPLQQSAVPVSSFQRAGPDTPPHRPAWLWPVVILASAACIILVAVGAYMVASSDGSSVDPNGTPTTGEKLTNEEIAESKSPYVVQILATWKAKDKAGVLVKDGANGTGVHLKNENGYAYFVTNRHVVEPPAKAVQVEYLLNFNGAEMPCEVVQLARYDLDLAMLRAEIAGLVDGPVLPSVKRKELKVGQECVAIGNALGGGISVTTGVISAFDKFPAGEYIRTSAPISSGNSGGGLFRTRDGVLIGITTLIMKEGADELVQNFNLAIPMDYVLDELFWE